MFQQLVGRALFGIFFGGSLGSAHKFNFTVIAHRLQPNLNRKSFAMLRSQLLHQYVRCLGATDGLKLFLQG